MIFTLSIPEIGLILKDGTIINTAITGYVLILTWTLAEAKVVTTAE